MIISSVTKVINGKKVIPKPHKSVQIPKATFIRKFISQLNKSLVRNSRVFMRIHKRSPIEKDFQIEIEELTSSVLQVVDSFPKSGQRIPAKFFKAVLSLLPKLEHFKLYISRLNHHSRPLTIVTKFLSDDVQHFINQVRQTYYSIAAVIDPQTGHLQPPSEKNIPNRHRDKQKEKIFLDAIEIYRIHDGRKKFMPYKFVSNLMSKNNLDFPERTFRTFKKDYLEGNFGKFSK
jgi:hypothetical protein